MTNPPPLNPLPPTSLSPQKKAELLEKYAKQMNAFAWKMQHKLPQSVSIDDIKQAGYQGVLQRIDRLSATANDKQQQAHVMNAFYWGVMDSLRDVDYKQMRRTRHNRRLLEQGKDQLRAKLGKEPELDETADHLQWAEASLNSLLATIEETTLQPYSENLEDLEVSITSQTSPGDPERNAAVMEMLRWVYAAIWKLDPLERTVYLLHKIEHYTFKEIALSMGGVHASGPGHIFAFACRHIESMIAPPRRNKKGHWINPDGSPATAPYRVLDKKSVESVTMEQVMSLVPRTKKQ